MVKPKCEMKSPRRRMSGPLSRAITRSRPITTSATTVNSVGANMKVVVRVRPPNEKEMGDNQRYSVPNILLINIFLFRYIAGFLVVIRMHSY